uniref:promotilin isoform X2 n=1 Tax=Macaca mulatta TaxID=9544 RepID=UPI0010A213C0|nr:promotilin isoform X2 [Macaca mulatta]
MGSKGSSQGWEVYKNPSDQSDTRRQAERDSSRPTQTTRTLSKMVSRKAVAALLVVHAAAMLASWTEAFVPIFTYGELQRMQEKERSKGQKKSLSVWQRSGEEGPVDPAELIEEEGNEMIKVSRQQGQGRETHSRACIPLPGLEAGPTNHSEPQSVLGYSSELHPRRERRTPTTR